LWNQLTGVALLFRVNSPALPFCLELTHRRCPSV
jgi:hypothetical protein